MASGGKGRLRGGATVRRERAGERPIRRDVSESGCHRERYRRAGGRRRTRGWTLPVRVPLGSIVELVGNLDRTTLATTSDAAWVTPPVARPVSDVRRDEFGKHDGVTLSTQAISRPDERSIERQAIRTRAQRSENTR